eukprot:15187494-Ditylum_brightwellii.AAC.1
MSSSNCHASPVSKKQSILTYKQNSEELSPVSTDHNVSASLASSVVNVTSPVAMENVYDVEE